METYIIEVNGVVYRIEAESLYEATKELRESLNN